MRPALNKAFCRHLIAELENQQLPIWLPTTCHLPTHCDYIDSPTSSNPRTSSNSPITSITSSISFVDRIHIRHQPPITLRSPRLVELVNLSGRRITRHRCASLNKRHTSTPTVTKQHLNRHVVVVTLHPTAFVPTSSDGR